MKYEWRKQEKNAYGAKVNPQILTVPKQNFLMIKGVGNPNQEDFSQRITALYALAYPLKMAFKKNCQSNPELAVASGFDDYTVYPLEGVWSTLNPDKR
ncbi:hypothetical protein M2139_001309 [Enterococcus sp. PF1-24]|nr:hypothetical protein [Enterococcus sp. PFB1-1]MDH6401425.1 hypothetical protein [Enterococcus sp. PF1-24]